MLSVTDLCDYARCPYSLYLKKVRRIRPPPNKAMVRGTIIHTMLEQCNRTEPTLVVQEVTADSTVKLIQGALFRNAYQHAKNAVLKHKQSYETAGGDSLDLLSQLKRDAKYDSLIKAASFKKACESKGYENAVHQIFPERSAEVPVQDKGLGLRGRIDAIEEPEPGVMVPIDYKTGTYEGGTTPAHRIQISAYSVLIERIFGCSAPMGIVIYTDYGTHVPVVVGTSAREEVLTILEASKKIVFTKKEPEKKEGKKCSGCMFAPYCT